MNDVHDIVYKNYRGEINQRTISDGRLRYGVSEWHNKPQWLLEAWDSYRLAIRTFAVCDIIFWDGVRVVQPPDISDEEAVRRVEQILSIKNKTEVLLDNILATLLLEENQKFIGANKQVKKELLSIIELWSKRRKEIHS